MKQLRDEANSVKDCFTRFSFQALAFAALMLGAAANYQPEEPLVGLVGVMVVVVVLTVSRIGGYKYGTANRHFAFELHYETSRAEDLIGWEEAHRAWRIVAAALFDALYVTPTDLPQSTGRRFLRRLTLGGEWNRDQLEPDMADRLKRKDFSEEQRCEMFWFDPREQVAPLTWHPGRYLEQMQAVLHLVAWLAMVPVFLMAVQLTPALAEALGLLEEAPTGWLRTSLVPAVAWLVAVRTLLGALVYTRNLNARREILESGMLCIPSSAVVWRTAIQAHRLAVETSRETPQHYAKHLSRIAEQVAAAPHELWDWLRNPSLPPTLERAPTTP